MWLYIPGGCGGTGIPEAVPIPRARGAEPSPTSAGPYRLPRPARSPGRFWGRLVGFERDWSHPAAAPAAALGVVPRRCFCPRRFVIVPAPAGAAQGRNSRLGKRDLRGAVSTSRAAGTWGQRDRPSRGQAEGELVAPGLGDRSAGSPGLRRDSAGSRRWRSSGLIIQPLGRLGNARGGR